MGERGPAPKPTALVLLEGNPGKRPINHAEPKPRLKTPCCPEHLDAEAKTEWKRLVRILRHMKLLTEADYISLANLCQAYSTMVKASCTKRNPDPSSRARCFRLSTPAWKPLRASAGNLA
jgi:phage terminase small subunit